MTVVADANGGFTATRPPPGTYTLHFQAQNSQGVHSAATTVTVVFPAGSGLTVNVSGRTRQNDRRSPTTAGSSRKIAPSTSTRIARPIRLRRAARPQVWESSRPSGPISTPATCRSWRRAAPGRFPAKAARQPQSSNWRTYLVVCDVGNGVCRPDTTGNGMTAVMPGAVALDPTKRYYISVLPGDAANPFTMDTLLAVARTEPRTLLAAPHAAMAWAALQSPPDRPRSRCSRSPRPSRQANSRYLSSKTTSR